MARASSRPDEAPPNTNPAFESDTTVGYVSFKMEFQNDSVNLGKLLESKLFTALGYTKLTTASKNDKETIKQ
ncbi:hypothetical protein [uncultured Ruegeria sp.]|uniref:hypothetical protein n=1 Tax=uncultured Ruegeria sp. TaxID=259304 RepID=UPI002607D7D6|nr:hypothetical protein [uncultured Ruegeria sp.]